MRARAMLSCLLFTTLLALGAAPAQANRALITEEAVNTEKITEKQLEGTCGVAVGGGTIYVSDYYRGTVWSFSAFAGEVLGGSSAGASPEGPCELALSSDGALYANVWHQSVVRLKPSFQLFDEDNSTGVAVDSLGNVYVNDRTYVAVYEPSGEPLLDGEGQPLKIGVGSLSDAYGLAVFAGKVYVPDAADSRIEVYEPGVDPDNPVATINGSATPQQGFNSLVDGDVTVDPTNGHLLVLDNLQPGYEHPVAAIDEFDSSGQFLGQLKKTVIDGEPSGLAVDPATGQLYATSGNSEQAQVFTFGPYTEGGPEAVEGEPEAPVSQGGEGNGIATVGEAAVAAPPGAFNPVSRSTAAKKKRRVRKRARQRRAQEQLSDRRPALPLFGRD